MPNTPSPINAPHWFDARTKQVGSWAFILNRLTGLGLTFYLILHLAVLNKLAQGASAYDDFVSFAQAPLIKVSEVVLIAAVLFHGLNGLRLILHAFSVGIRQQKRLFGIVVLATMILSTAFAIHLFRE